VEETTRERSEVFDMAVRIISSLVGIPILLFFVISGGVFLKLALALISCLGMYELYMAVSKKIKPVHFVGFITEILYIVFLDVPLDNVYLKIYILIATMLILSMLVFLHSSINVHDAAITVFGFLYVGVLLGCLYTIRTNTIVLAWVPFICAFGSDTCAYFTGTAIGKHKLTPVLSPHKSIEGAVGGVVGAALLCGLYCFVASLLNYVSGEHILKFCLMGAVGSVFAQIGDLAASSIKRYTGIKDYGKIMPGHGGMLDRFDSVLFTVPLVYIFMCLINFN
jgi:phosphatidate cytidylyltransferase